MRPKPLVYLMQQLGIKVADWQHMSDKDKDDLKLWADEEMTALGMS